MTSLYQICSGVTSMNRKTYSIDITYKLTWAIRKHSRNVTWCLPSLIPVLPIIWYNVVRENLFYSTHLQLRFRKFPSFTSGLRNLLDSLISIIVPLNSSYQVIGLTRNGLTTKRELTSPTFPTTYTTRGASRPKLLRHTLTRVEDIMN